MPFEIVCDDITKMEVDAIVNAANTALQRGGGVCGAIFKAAGIFELQAACDELAPVKTGEAVITPGFNLPAKYIIHTPGPRYHSIDPRQADLSPDESEGLLRNCYLNSLSLATEHDCKSIAFPLIASGTYGYPQEAALTVAIGAILDFLRTHSIQVFLVLFSENLLEIASTIVTHRTGAD